MKLAIKYTIVSLIILVFCVTFVAKKFYAQSEKKQVEIIAVSPSVEPESMSLRIMMPSRGEVAYKTPVWIQVRMRGFPIGVDSELPRSDEISNSPNGQSIHVIIDNKPYFARTGMVIDPFNNEGDYYQAMYKFKIPFELSEGMHTIRAFAARSFGEGLKGPRAFETTYFYIKSDKKNDKADLTKPFLTYNEPSGFFKLKEGDPILLDFYVSNAVLAQTGYKVKVTLDDVIEQDLTSLTPYYIYGLKRGTHKIHMQLVDSSNQQVPGVFNDITRIFAVD